MWYCGLYICVSWSKALRVAVFVDYRNEARGRAVLWNPCFTLRQMLFDIQLTDNAASDAEKLCEDSSHSICRAVITIAVFHSYGKSGPIAIIVKYDCRAVNFSWYL